MIKQWLLQERLAFNEQYLVEALLSFNPAFAVAFATHWLGLDHPSRTNHLWPEVDDRHDPATAGFYRLWFYQRATNDLKYDN